MKLKDKVAIITGGSGSIGKAIAKAFLREGARVMIASRSREELAAAKVELGEDSPSVAVCCTDVTRSGDVKMLVQTTVQAFSTVHIIVNVAGIYGPIGPSVEADFEKWKKTFEVNVFGTFRMMQEVLPIMTQNNYGKVINFSGGGDGPLPRFSAYHASKGAVVRLTETFAAEVRGDNIDINAIAPGAVNSAFLDEALAAGEDKVGKEKYQALLDQKASGGVSPEKAAEVCVFLASSASDGLSGKFLSAVWDPWQKWDKKEIEEIMRGDFYTLRRKTPQ